MNDHLDFEEVLGICLDRLQDGDTLEACLARYPAYAGRLAPLLQMAAALRTSDGPSMSAAGLRTGEARLLAHAARLRTRQRGRAPARQRRGISGLLGGTRRRIAAAVLSVLLVCGVLSAGTVSAASSSLPGSQLYPVKRATEALVSSLAFTPQLQAHVHLAWAERRLREVEALTVRDGLVDETILAALEQETERALTAAEQAEPDQLTTVIAHTERQQEILGQLLETAPQPARAGLQRALAASAQGRARAQSALEQAGSSLEGAGSSQPAVSPGSPVTSPGRADEEPPSKGQGQGVRPIPGKGTGQGPGRGQGQDKDKAEDPDGAQGPGNGQDKGKQPPADNGQGHGNDPNPGQDPGQAPGRNRGQGQSDEKQNKEDNPGRGRDKVK